MPYKSNEREQIRQKTDEFIKYLLSTEEYRDYKKILQIKASEIRECDLVFDFRDCTFKTDICVYPIDRLALFTTGYWNPEGMERKVATTNEEKKEL